MSRKASIHARIQADSRAWHRPISADERPLLARNWIGAAREAAPRLESCRSSAGSSYIVIPSVQPLKGFGGAGVLEVVEDHSSSTYRAVYTVRFERVVYVLHVFQKKSVRGIATPASDMALVRQRLRDAEEHYVNVFLPTRRLQGGEG